VNHDDIGDTPYVIDVLDRDSFPLMQSPVKPPVSTSKSPMPLEAIVLGVSAPVALIAAAFAVKQKRKQKNF
jgi:hypothetical protein